MLTLRRMGWGVFCLILLSSFSTCQKESTLDNFALNDLQLPSATTSSHFTFATPAILEAALGDQQEAFAKQGLMLDFDHGLVLSTEHQEKALSTHLILTPVLDHNNMFTGLIVKNNPESEGVYYDYEAMRRYAKSNEPVCDHDINAMMSFLFLIELHIYHRVPDQAFSFFLEKVAALDCSEKTYRQEVNGQYIEYCANGIPCAVVSYTYTITVECGNGGGGGTNEGGGGPNPPGDDIFIELEGGVPTIETEEDPDVVAAQSVSNLRNWLVNNCGFSFDDPGQLSVAAGIAFENAVVRLLGGNNSSFHQFSSNVRNLATNGSLPQVQPDYVRAAVRYNANGNTIQNLINFFQGDLVEVFNDFVFHEVKARNSTIELATSNYQIAGHIDALSTIADGYNNPPAPALFIYTLPEGNLSNGVRNFANDYGVQIFHVTVNVSANGTVSINQVDQVNAAGGNSSINFANRTAELECPPDSLEARLDVEELPENEN